MSQRDGNSGSSGKGEKENFRPDIEGLRGIAVMLVVIYHAGLLSNAPWQLTGGFIGVDLFFVVSGFLITGLLIRERERNGRISFSRFYARRVRRILPAAAYVLVVTLPVAYLLVNLMQRAAVMQDGAAAALSFANFRFIGTTDYFNIDPSKYSPYLHFWSLGVEEQFYFIWPALLFVAAWKRPRIGAALALGAIVVGSFLASAAITKDNQAWAFYMLPTRAWQLASGGLLAIGAGSLVRLPQVAKTAIGRVLAVAGWVALAVLLLDAVVLDSTKTPYPGTAALVPTAAGVLLLASGMQKYGPGLVLRLMPIRFLGKISYSLYLWHWPLLILGGLYFGQEIGGFSLTVQQAVVLAAIAIPVATLSWLLIEEPFRRGKIPLPRPSRVVIAGVSFMLIVAMMGAGFGQMANTALANVSGPDIAETDSPTPSEGITLKPTPTPTPHSLKPGTTATPTPLFSPALTQPPDGSCGYGVSCLRPSLAKIAKDGDREKIWPDGCEVKSFTTKPCTKVYGDPNGTFTVALLGDSHAASLFPAVEQVAIAHHWRLLVLLKVGCQFLDMRLMYASTPEREYTECPTFKDNVIATLNKNPPDLILLMDNRYSPVVIGSQGTVTYEGQALGREIGQLPSTSRVVIIKDYPYSPFNVPDCLGNHLSDWRRCSFSYDRGVGYSQNGKREQIAAGMTGAAVVNIDQAICPGEGTCPPVINGLIVWRDEHHLTKTFSATIGWAVDQALAPIIVDMQKHGATP